MQPFTNFQSRLVPLPNNNIDTDQIIPARFLKTTSKEGLDKQLFCDWRYDERGNPKPDFILNQPRAKDAEILLAGDNFGCGSSREHAPQALQRWGIDALVGEGYSEIFFGNSVQLGLPCLTVSQDEVERLMAACEADPTSVVDVDVAGLIVRCGSIAVTATMPRPAYEALTTGLWDGTGLLLDDFDEVKRLANQLPYVTGSW